MMQFAKRPNDRRNSFQEKAARHVAALMALLNDDGTPNHAAINAYIDDHQIWGDVKSFFMEAQNRKCGFCEGFINESTGDVEHYRPKNAVWSLASRGEELENLVNVRGRKFDHDFGSG